MWRSCIAAGHKAVRHADPALFSSLLGPSGATSAPRNDTHKEAAPSTAAGRGFSARCFDEWSRPNG